MDKNKLLTVLKDFPDLSTAILFGSHAIDRASASSDIDIGIYFSSKVPNSFEILQFKQDISDQMGSDVDLVVLNTASPIIAMQVVKTGEILFNKDPKKFREFEVRLITDYADLKVILSPFEKNILKRKLHD